MRLRPFRALPMISERYLGLKPEARRLLRFAASECRRSHRSSLAPFSNADSGFDIDGEVEAGLEIRRLFRHASS